MLWLYSQSRAKKAWKRHIWRHRIVSVIVCFESLKPLLYQGEMEELESVKLSSLHCRERESIEPKNWDSWLLCHNSLYVRPRFLISEKWGFRCDSENESRTGTLSTRDVSSTGGLYWAWSDARSSRYWCSIVGTHPFIVIWTMSVQSPVPASIFCVKNQ